MSSTEKVNRVASVRDEYGLVAALVAVELPKVLSSKSESLLRREVRSSAADPGRDCPGASRYGYRRTQKELAESYQYHYSQEVVRRLHRLWDLRLLRSTQPPPPSPVRQVITEAGKRVNLVAQLAEIGLFGVAYTDFTELPFANGTRKAYLMPILGHQSKLVYGWANDDRADTQTALRAWTRAKVTFQALAIPYAGMIIHHDQEPVVPFIWMHLA